MQIFIHIPDKTCTVLKIHPDKNLEHFSKIFFTE